MKFSVIIPVRTINDYLKETVSHLKKVRYYDFEVIIVLDKYVKVNFGLRETRFRVIESGPVSPGNKRNVGAREALGDVLVFLDDDAYPDISWLRNAANVFRDNPELYALGGPALTPPNAEFLEKISGCILESYLTSGFTAFRHKTSEPREIDDHPSVNLFVKKEAFNEVGGFDTEYWPGEDTKLCLDLINRYDRKFLYDPSPVVYHHRRELFKPFLQQISRYGRHRGWFARVFPKNSFKLAYFIPSLFVLWLVFGLVGSFFIPKLWSVYLPIIFLYFTLVFTEAQRASMEEKNFTAFKYLFLGIIGTHLSYGANFIIGFIKRPKLALREVDNESGSYVGG